MKTIILSSILLFGSPVNANSVESFSSVFSTGNSNLELTRYHYRYMGEATYHTDYSLRSQARRPHLFEETQCQVFTQGSISQDGVEKVLTPTDSNWRNVTWNQQSDRTSYKTKSRFSLAQPLSIIKDDNSKYMKIESKATIQRDCIERKYIGECSGDPEEDDCQVICIKKGPTYKSLQVGFSIEAVGLDEPSIRIMCDLKTYDTNRSQMSLEELRQGLSEYSIDLK